MSELKADTWQILLQGNGNNDAMLGALSFIWVQNNDGGLVFSLFPKPYISTLIC
jgi:hypothetical protein